MTGVRLALLLGALASAPAVARAQATAESRLAGRLDPRTAAAVSALIDSMSAQGAPDEPLIAKALEGASKQAAGERILVAVRRLANDLRSARLALGDSASEAEVVAGASALNAGAPAELLGRVKAVCGPRSALLPLATLADLMIQGMPVDRASATVLALAQRGAGAADYRAVQSAALNAGSGGSPGRSQAPAATGDPGTARPPAPRSGAPGPPVRGRPAARP